MTAGWYRTDGDRLRYWDGRAWTARRRELGAVTIRVSPAGDPFYNALLTVVTCGLWAPVWMARAGERRKIKRR